MQIKKYLAVLAVLTVTAVGTFAIAHNWSKSRRGPEPAGVCALGNGPAFTVTQEGRTNGKADRTVIRIFKTTGEWKETTTFLATDKQTVMYGLQNGVIRVNEEKKQSDYIGRWAPPLPEEKIRADSAFVDESTLLGYKVLRLHMAAQDGSNIDLYKAPALHGMILKVEEKHDDGSSFVLEPVKIDMGNVQDFAPPNYPVSSDVYNRNHQAKAPQN
jgi:hypothetical protein